MTTRKDDGRKLIQLTMSPDLYDQIRQHCQSMEVPITVWARMTLKQELDRLAGLSNATNVGGLKRLHPPTNPNR
jgi:hypothetical protein